MGGNGLLSGKRGKGAAKGCKGGPRFKYLHPGQKHLPTVTLYLVGTARGAGRRSSRGADVIFPRMKAQQLPPFFRYILRASFANNMQG